jgi:hypothetical protein
MAKSRGIHTKPVDGHSIEWLTPEWIIDALGPFDLDPCAHPKQPWKTATTMIAPPQNGLKVKWSDYGVAFVNPPYGRALTSWARKTAKEGNAFLLVPARTEVLSWFVPYVWRKASAILFLRGRLYFRKPDGSMLGNAGHGSIIAAYGEECKERLRTCDIPGMFVDLEFCEEIGKD